MMNFESFSKLTREGQDAAMRSFAAMTSGAQTVASESVEFARRSFEQGQKATEQLMGARSLDVVLQIQGDYLRTSYEGLVAQTAKMGQLAVNVAKDAVAPLEGVMAKPAV